MTDLARADANVDAIRRRLALVRALSDVAAGGTCDGATLLSHANEHRSLRGGDSVGDVVWAYVELVEAIALLVQWRQAVRHAEADADRFLRAAKARAVDVLASNRQHPWPDEVLAVAEAVRDLSQEPQIAVIADALARVALPVRVTQIIKVAAAADPRQQQAQENDTPTRTPTVALVLRHLGEPVMRPTPFQPGALHQLDLEVRVSIWPEGASELVVDFLHVHPRDYLYVGEARFGPEESVRPVEVRIAGDRPSAAPPLLTTARAVFLRDDERLPAALVGNTTLELVTFDPGTAQPLNMPTTARRIRQMLDELRNALPALPDGERRDVHLLLNGLARFGHTVLDDRLDASQQVDEAWFQRELRFFLQADPNIGGRLQERSGRAGGVLDLSLGNVVLELKVEKVRAASLGTVAGYAQQAVQYASAADCPVSLLAVLDVSKKTAPAGVMGNSFGWVYPDTSTGTAIPSLVGVAIIAGGFPVPSDFA